MTTQISLKGFKTTVDSNFANIDASQVLTGVFPVSRGGTGVSTSTGTGSVVLSADPVFTGTASFANISAANGLALSNLHASNVTAGILNVARGGTGVSTSTGTGSVVLSANPVFTGTAAFANISAANGLALSNLHASNVTAGILNVSRGGTGVSTSTGTGSVVLSADPVFTGTAAFANISAANGLALSNLHASNVTAGILNVSRGGTGVSTSTGTGSVVLSTGPFMSNIINVVGTSNTPSYTFCNDTNTGMWSPGIDEVSWAIAGVERMRLRSNGTLVVGSSFTSNVTGPSLYVGTATNTTIGIYSEGDVFAASDARLKKDIEPISDALARLRRITGYTYRRVTKHSVASGEEEENKKRSAGVLAQDVQAVLPEVVEQDGDGFLSVSYGNLNALLIEAIKELGAKVDLLEGRLEAI